MSTKFFNDLNSPYQNNFLKPSPKTPRHNNSMNAKEMAKQLPSSRLSMGMGNRVRDIVAIFPQGEPSDPSRLNFVEHVNRNDKRIFSVSTTAPAGKHGEVRHVGVEEAAGESFEYVLAVVDRHTGRPIEIRPTAVVSFEPRFKPSEEILTGRKRKLAVDYTKDFSSAPENFREDRKRLTEDFGSLKKNKMLDLLKRRTIGNETLEAMKATAFSSINAIVVKDEDGGDSANEAGGSVKKESKSSPLSLSILENKSSSILPVPNYDAKVPGDIYKLEQFLPPNYAEFRNEYEAEALAFFTKYDNFQILIQTGICPVVAKRIGTPMRYANPGRRCCLALKMVALSKFVQKTFKRKYQQTWISATDLSDMKIPNRMMDCIRNQFLTNTAKSAGMVVRFPVDQQEKHQALAQLLCLMLLFDEPEFLVGISPLVQELGPSEKALKNLLTGLGCVITVANEAQALTMNTLRVARLVKAPKNELRTNTAGKSNKKRR